VDENTTPDMTEDAAVARVRAADLASAAEPDSTGLRTGVDERIGGTGVDELAARRARRWASWPVRMAGVAAATLVVGMGGGYAIGAAGDGQGAAPPITLQAPVPMGADGAEMAADTAVRTDMAIWPGYWGRTVFTASGLSSAGGSAQAYAFDARQAFSEQTIAALATALGVEGNPSLQDGMWTVGPNDGSAASVQVFADGTASVYYYDPTKDVWRCVTPQETLKLEEDAAAEGGVSQPSEGDGTQPPDEGVVPPDEGVVPPDEGVVPPDEGVVPPDVIDPCTEQNLGAAPKGDAAITVLRDTLRAIGLDPGDFEFVTEDYGEDAWTYVTAYQVVDGQRTGMAWSASLSGAGLQSLNGSLAPLSPLGEYDVISPEEAVQRLSDPRFGSSGGGYYPLAEDGATRAMEDAPVAATPSVPAPVSPGSRIGWPVSQVTITGARLGLAMHTQLDGAVLLVPSYELTSGDGGVWSVIAVADSHLDFAAEG
jgi:hypothetical protein